MTTPLNRVYRELEQDARDYADPDRALAALRRRRTRRGLTAASLAIVIGVGGVVLHERAPTPANLAVPALQPPGVIEPPGNAVALPAGTAVGRGVLIYSPCRNCANFLVTADGRQYRLDSTPASGNFTLSPDGRYLGMPVGENYRSFDLIGGGTADIRRDAVTERPGYVLRPWVWTADPNFLVLAAHRDGDVDSYVMIDMSVPGANIHRLPPPAGRKITIGYMAYGYLSTGTPLELDERIHEQTPFSRQTEGVAFKEVPLSNGSTLKAEHSPSETFSDKDHGLQIQVRGERIYAVTYSAEGTAVVQYDLRGRRLARMPLMADETPLGPSEYGYTVIRGQYGSEGSQTLVSLSPTAVSLSSTGVSLSSTGRRELLTLPGTATVVLPGMARY
ncbi:hypothetical protein [Rhizohabitans arisaemae]|uniref:hypothetical protein n=1 Tax=Rhizohabitans arisaemae TaxID=2720610 RepID=UPI0024B20518|nr:hypothetical protein [Rhizohabitans arisaemae]